MGDKGTIRFDGGSIDISDVKKRGEGLFVHMGTVVEGELSKGDAVEMEVDHASRAGSRSHHSATHLIHEALREVLGDHVAQKGSLVAPDRLRFDFSHQKAIPEEDLAIVEEMSNEIVRQSSPVETRLMAVDDCQRNGKAEKHILWNCVAVRMFQTPVKFGLIRLLGESAVSSGVRRIEALTGEAALNYLGEQEQRVKDIATTLKVPPHNAVDRVVQLVDERKKLERELADAKKQLALGGGSGGSSATGKRCKWRAVSWGKLLKILLQRNLKVLVDDAKQTIKSGVVAIAGVSEDGKAGVVVGVTADLTEKFSAVDMVRIAV
ncbi:Alanine--tRNA ligase [Nymphon striatum]|nr:Alanine--tRNA ligase [Nymphon striatum]